MKKAVGWQSNWKIILVILSALVGGFLLSFIGFGVLWSGAPWHFQLLMAFPFLLLSFIVFHWGKGAIDNCILILLGAAPLGMLMTQFRDTNGSHLMPILVVFSWILGIISGYFLGKLLPCSRAESFEDISSP